MVGTGAAGLRLLFSIFIGGEKGEDGENILAREVIRFLFTGGGRGDYARVRSDSDGTDKRSLRSQTTLPSVFTSAIRPMMRGVSSRKARRGR